MRPLYHLYRQHQHHPFNYETCQFSSIMALLHISYILSNMVSIIDEFLKDLKVNGTAEKVQTDYSKFLKNINKVKSLEKWDKNDVNMFLMNKRGEGLVETVDLFKTKLKRFFTWAGKSELVNHLNT